MLHALFAVRDQRQVLCFLLMTFLTSCNDGAATSSSKRPSPNVELDCHCDSTTVQLDSAFHVACELRNDGPSGIYFLWRIAPHRQDGKVHTDVNPRLSNPVLSEGMIIAAPIGRGGSPEDVRRAQELMIGDHYIPPEAVLLVARSAHRFNVLINLARVRHLDTAPVGAEQFVHLIILAAYTEGPPLLEGGSEAHRELYNRTFFVAAPPIRLWLGK